MNFEEFSCSVITDDKWFEIMMEQIISNSAKYTVRGEVHIYMKEGNQLIVADTGMHILLLMSFSNDTQNSVP